MQVKKIHHMKSKKINTKLFLVVKLCIFLLLCLSYTGLKAQETILISGGNISGNNGSVSYSVGQIAYTINSGTNGTVIPGVQQPYEISVVSGIKEAKGINLECSVYPNPTTNYLTLKIENNVQTQYIASLYDMNGILLKTFKITNNETTISMENLIPSTYFLKIMQIDSKHKNKTHYISTFKIIKN